MEIFSALLVICAGNSPVPGEFPAQRPVTRSFDVFFDLRPNKWLSKHWWGWWFETPWCPLWRHCNVRQGHAFPVGVWENSTKWNLSGLACTSISLRWRHNGHGSVSNHQPQDCLLNCLFGRRSKYIKAPCHWPLCGEFTGDRWIPRTNGQLRGKCFHLMTSSWFNSNTAIILFFADKHSVM